MIAINILIYLFIARIQENFADQHPAWQWGFGYALAASLLSFQGVVMFILNFVILGFYSWGYFALLRRFTDNLLIWLLIYFGGVVVPVILPFFLIK